LCGATKFGDHLHKLLRNGPVQIMKKANVAVTRFPLNGTTEVRRYCGAVLTCVMTYASRAKKRAGHSPEETGNPGAKRMERAAR
jgi:hypothetical protein